MILFGITVFFSSNVKMELCLTLVADFLSDLLPKGHRKVYTSQNGKSLPGMPNMGFACTFLDTHSLFSNNHKQKLIKQRLGIFKQTVYAI